MRRLGLVLATAFAMVSPPLLEAGANAPVRDPSSLVKIGDTEQQVKNVLGMNYTVCTATDSAALCKEPVWLYRYVHGRPLGIAVKFHHRRVMAVIRLGTVAGFRPRTRPS